MKIRKDTDIIKFIGISLSAVLAGIIIFLFIEPVSVIGFLLILGGLMGLGIGLLVASKPRCNLIKDERSVRVKEKAGFYTFVALMAIAGIIALLRLLKLSALLTPPRDLADGAEHMWIIGLFSFLILRWYYGKKGDLE